MVHINSLYLIYALLSRIGIVAITRFLGGTFGQNLVGGGTKTFYRTGDVAPLLETLEVTSGFRASQLSADRQTKNAFKE